MTLQLQTESWKRDNSNARIWLAAFAVEVEQKGLQGGDKLAELEYEWIGGTSCRLLGAAQPVRAAAAQLALDSRRGWQLPRTPIRRVWVLQLRQKE